MQQLNLIAALNQCIFYLIWIIKSGQFIGGIIVVLYCFSGTSIWTDIAQSFVMIIAMCLMVFFGIKELGGISNF